METSISFPHQDTLFTLVQIIHCHTPKWGNQLLLSFALQGPQYKNHGLHCALGNLELVITVTINSNTAVHIKNEIEPMPELENAHKHVHTTFLRNALNSKYCHFLLIYSKIKLCKVSAIQVLGFHLHFTLKQYFRVRMAHWWKPNDTQPNHNMVQK